MSDLDPFEILDNYHLKEKADAEIQRNKKKLDEPPYNMQGRNEIYCKFLNEEWRKLRVQRDEYTQKKCDKSDSECLFIRLDKAKKEELCSDCVIAKEIDSLESSMKELVDASRKLKEDADYDWTHR